MRPAAAWFAEGQLCAADPCTRTARFDAVSCQPGAGCNRIANRMQKVLEDANIKLASVATDALGASGRAMLDAIIEGKSDSHELAEMSKGLRNKKAELQLALEGHVTEHHRFLLKQLMKHLRFTEERMKDVEIARRMAPHQEALVVCAPFRV